MNKKERTIKALETLVDFYSVNDGKMPTCPLCDVHHGYQPRACVGCPSADENGDEGCCDFESFDLHDTVGTIRKAFWLKYLPIIKKWPAERFTRKGWTYSEEISRED